MQNEKQRIDALEVRLGVSFMNGDLLREALTHSSYAYEKRSNVHNERLEFLGDAVLNMVAAEFVMTNFPRAREGFLTQKRMRLVRTTACAEAAVRLGVHETLLLGHSDEYLRAVQSVQADVMEAVIGALYLDAGLPTVRDRMLAWQMLKV